MYGNVLKYGYNRVSIWLTEGELTAINFAEIKFQRIQRVVRPKLAHNLRRNIYDLN